MRGKDDMEDEGRSTKALAVILDVVVIAAFAAVMLLVRSAFGGNQPLVIGFWFAGGMALVWFTDGLVHDVEALRDGR